MKIQFLTFPWMCILAALPCHAAQEAYVDLWQAVGDAEFVIVGTVEAVQEDSSVVMTVQSWLKGKPAASGTVSLKGETGHCAIQGPVSHFMRKGERFLVFIFPNGKAGRLGHIQPINADGSLQERKLRFMMAGTDAPATEVELASRIRHIQTPDFAREEIAKLSAPDMEAAQEALRRLGAARASVALDPILAVACDRTANRKLRETAISALGRLKDTKALAPLVEILSQDPDGWGHYAAAALGELGDRRAVPALVDTLKNSTKNRNQHYSPVSATCVQALGQIGHYSDDVKVVLSEMLKLPGEYPAISAIQMAQSQKLRWMTPALIDALDSATPSVSGNAALAIAAIAGMSWEAAAPERGPLKRDKVLLLGSRAVAEKSIPDVGGSPSLRNVGGIGWVLTYSSGAGPCYVYVGDREGKAEVLLPHE